MPFVFAGGGIGAVWLMDCWQKAIKIPRETHIVGIALRTIGYVVSSIMLAWVGWTNVNYYFNNLATAASTKWVYAHDLVAALEHINTLPQEGLYVYFYAPRWSYNYETRRYLIPTTPGEDRSREFGRYSLEKNQDNVAYVMLPPYHSIVDELRSMYPTGTYHELRDGKRLLFASYYVGKIEQTKEPTP